MWMRLPNHKDEDRVSDDDRRYVAPPLGQNPEAASDEKSGEG